MHETTLEHSGMITHSVGAAAIEGPKQFATEAAMMPHLGMGDSISILGSAPWPDAPWWQRIAPSTLFVLLSSAVAIFFLAHELVIAGKLGFPTSGAWIRIAYARNFFHHLAFEYAPGTPSPAPTSPFWIVVLSLAVNLFRDPILAGKLLGTIFLFLTGYYSFRLLRALELDYATSLLAGVLIVTSGALAWAELSGLESTLSTSLVAGALWWHFSHPGKVPDWLHFFVTGSILALGTLTRPEISIVFGILTIWQFFQNDQYKFRHCLMLAIGFLLVLAPVGITNFAVSGAFVPSTFRGAVGNDSIIRAIWHGTAAGVFLSLLHSVEGILVTIRDVYLASNPVWIVGIIIALWSRWHRSTIEPDVADPLFSLTVFILIAYPYFRTLLIGSPDSFGEYERLVHFLIPIYTLSGILSIRIVARNELFRSMSPKQMVIGSACMILLLGSVYLLLGPNASEVFAPIVNCLLLLFFTAILFIAGLRHADIPLLKKERNHEVTEAERLETHFSFHEDGRSDAKLSVPAVLALNAVLMVLLAWNLALLPRAANNFASEVKTVNTNRSHDTGELLFNFRPIFPSFPISPFKHNE